VPTVLAGVTRLEPERIRHVASPLIELGCALHVLAEPAHHDRVDWAASLPLSAELRAELAQWTWTVRAVRARFFATSAATGVPTWTDELAALRSRPPEDVAAELVRPLRGRPLSSRSIDTDAVQHWARSRGRSVAALVESLLTSPAEPVRRFLDVLDACWREWFGELWEASHDTLAARGRQDRDLAVRDGLGTMLRSLDSAIDVRDADSVVVQKVQSKRIDISTRSLLLVPSNYIAPHLFVGEIPGVLWTPGATSVPAPLILMGHPGGLARMYPRLLARARHSAADGYATATIELPGSGDRPRSAVVDRARADLRRALEAGEPVDDDIVDRLILPLVDTAVPEWRATLDALLALPEIGGPVGFAGGVIAIGTRLAVVEPRISAAVLFAGSFVPRAILEEARHVTIPLLVLLQWDDEGNDRQMALDLFDAFGSTEKTLHANMGGHTGVPQFEGDDGSRFFARHLKSGPAAVQRS